MDAHPHMNLPLRYADEEEIITRTVSVWMKRGEKGLTFLARGTVDTLGWRVMNERGWGTSASVRTPTYALEDLRFILDHPVWEGAPDIRYDNWSGSSMTPQQFEKWLLRQINNTNDKPRG